MRIKLETQRVGQDSLIDSDRQYDNMKIGSDSHVDLQIQMLSCQIMKDKFTGDRVKGEKVKSSRRACLISTKRGQYNKNDESRKEESNFPERCGIVGKRARKEKVYPISIFLLIFLREGQTRDEQRRKIASWPRLDYSLVLYYHNGKNQNDVCFVWLFFFIFVELQELILSCKLQRPVWQMVSVKCC